MSTQRFAKDQPEGFSNRIERVAIVGAGGRQGAQITEQLLKTGKHTITALTRIGSTSKLPDNIKTVPIDYEDEESIALALKGQQLLIITLAVNVDPEVHHRIVRAAGKAGIRYIIPNIYAANVVIENQGSVNDFFPTAPPINLLKEIERVGVSSWILLVGGVWFDYSLPSGESFMGFDIGNRKVTLFDDGEAKINTSTLAQFGRAAAAIASLKELPNDEDDKSSTIAQFRNKPVYLSSFYVSQKDILRSVQRVTNTTDADWEIKHESSADRIENGKAMGRSGNIMGLVQAYYSFIFSPGGQKLKTQDNRHNELLGLPEEDLDGVVKDCVEKAENKFRPLAIINDLAEKGCQDKISGSKFLAKDLSVELPPGYSAWKVICWHCEKFADIKPLFKKFNVRKDLHGYLIQTAFLRLDRSFLNQLACYRNYGDRWRPNDILIMVEAALSSDDAGYLLWILEHLAASVISGHRIAILQLVYNSRRLRHIDTMIQVVIPRPADIAAAIAWYLVSSDEQSFGGFLQLIEDRGGSFSSKTAEEAFISVLLRDLVLIFMVFQAIKRPVPLNGLFFRLCSLQIHHFSAFYWNEKS
ncbi:hypothetical protein FOVSG1_008279 [Fusarium oxysporum f. sp. vasinfectum]